MRPEAIRLLEENIGSKLPDIGLGNNFLDLTPETDNKCKNEQVRLYQIKKLCTAKETINKIKRQPSKWEKIFVNHIANKG